MNRAPTVHCPTCKTAVEWCAASTYRPFCSERCKLIDLGEWVSENHRIPGEELPQGALHDLDKAPRD